MHDLIGHCLVCCEPYLLSLHFGLVVSFSDPAFSTLLVQQVRVPHPD